MADEEKKSDGYILNRDWRGMARLNYRHLLFELIQGYLLHPSIQIPENASIAEIGAGTCLWPIELSKKLPPSVSIDAIDISFEQCPPESWLPKNMNLVRQDMYKTLPSALVGKYDVIRIQNWLCIWRDATSKPFVSNVVKMLKPGGYIQWSEQDPTVNRIVHAPDTSTPDKGTQEILDFLAAPRGDINFKWISQLDAILSEHLDLITFDRHEIPNEHQVFWSISVMQACEEFGSNLLKNAKNEKDKEIVQNLQISADKAAGELLNGVGIHQELVVAVARKPQK